MRWTRRGVCSSVDVVGHRVPTVRSPIASSGSIVSVSGLLTAPIARRCTEPSGGRPPNLVGSAQRFPAVAVVTDDDGLAPLETGVAPREAEGGARVRRHPAGGLYEYGGTSRPPRPGDAGIGI